MYKVYGRIQSRASRVIWMLEELGQAYEFIDVGPHDPQVLALNTSGKVPVLLDGETVLTDSSAILTYLADKHGTLTYPAGTKDRAAQDALFHTLLDEFDAALWVATRHSFILPEDKRVPAVKETAKWEFDRSFKRLEDRFTGPFLMGDKMTTPDIVLIHCMGWAKAAGFPLNSDVLKAYGKKVRDRPAYKKLAEIAQGS